MYGGNPVRYTFVRKRCQEQEKNLKKKRIWIYMAAALSILLLLGGCSSKSSRISAGTAAVETTTDSLPESAQTLNTRQAASLAETVSLQETKVGREGQRESISSGAFPY